MLVFLYILFVPIYFWQMAGIVVAAEDTVRVQLQASQSETAPGDRLFLTVSLEENPGLAGLVIRFHYDKERLTLLSASHGSESSYASAVIFPEEDSMEQEKNIDAQADGMVGFAYVEMKNQTQTGELLKAEFEVKQAAKEGEAVFTYELLDASDMSGQSLDIQGNETIVKITKQSVEGQKTTEDNRIKRKEQETLEKGKADEKKETRDVREKKETKETGETRETREAGDETEISNTTGKQPRETVSEQSHEDVGNVETNETVKQEQDVLSETGETKTTVDKRKDQNERLEGSKKADSKKNSRNGYGLCLILIAGVLIIGGVVFSYYKKKREN